MDDRWKLGGTFIYGTGNAITVPAQRYFVDGNLLDVYGPRNGFRMPAYHRADIGATHTPRTKLNKKRKSERYGQWVFSVYNVYNRLKSVLHLLSATKASHLPKGPWTSKHTK